MKRDHRPMTQTQNIKMTEEESRYQKGLLCAISCYILWGCLPIYWKALLPIGSVVIIFYRTVLAGAASFFFAWKLYGWAEIRRNLKPKGALGRHFLAGLLIAVNMSLYVIAVNSDNVIQGSIGYYMQPLVVSLCGIIFYKEKLTGGKLAALIFIVMGLTIYLIHFGRAPWLALGMAGAFGIYGALKKGSRLPAALSFFYEMLFFMPVCFVVILYLEFTGTGALGVGEPYQYGLLLLSGIITAVPLILFSAAAAKIPLIVLGLIEYINPTIQLLLGILLFGEPFDSVQFAAFAVVWVGLAIFVIGERKQAKKGHAEA